MASEAIHTLSKAMEQARSAFAILQADDLVNVANSVAALDARSAEHEKKLVEIGCKMDEIKELLSNLVSRLDMSEKAAPHPVVERNPTPPLTLPDKNPIEIIRDTIDPNNRRATYDYIMSMDERTLDFVLPLSGLRSTLKTNKKKKKITKMTKQVQVLEQLGMKYGFPPKHPKDGVFNSESLSVEQNGQDDKAAELIADEQQGS